MRKINACFYLLVDTITCVTYFLKTMIMNDLLWHLWTLSYWTGDTWSAENTSVRFFRKFTKIQICLRRISSSFQGLSFYFVSSRFNLEPNCRMKLLRREKNPWRVVFSYCTMRNTLWIPEKVRLNLVRRFILYNAMRNTLYLPRFWWSMESQKK